MDAFLLLSKNATGKSLAMIIKDAISAPGIMTFGELLALENVQSLRGTEDEPVILLLELFAYGTYLDYLTARDALPPLTETQLRKLKQLTVVSMAQTERCLPCDQLQKDLHIGSLRELEDLIIEMIYGEVISGRLDQQTQTLQVEHTMGRDIKAENIPELVSILEHWCTQCDSVLSSLRTEVGAADQRRVQYLESRSKHRDELESVKTAVKTQQSAPHSGSTGLQAMETDEDRSSENVKSAGGSASKRQKAKGGLRGSKAIFNK